MDRTHPPLRSAAPAALLLAAVLLAGGCASVAPFAPVDPLAPADPRAPARDPSRFLVSATGGPGWFRGDVAENGLRGEGSAAAAAFGLAVEGRFGPLSTFGEFLGLEVADDLGYSRPAFAGQSLDVDHSFSLFNLGAGWRLAHSRTGRTESRERFDLDRASGVMVPAAAETLPVDLWRVDLLAGGRAIHERARASDRSGGSTVDSTTEGIGWGEAFAGVRLEVRPAEGWFVRLSGDAGGLSPDAGTTLHGSFATGLDLGSRVHLVLRAETWRFDFEKGATGREEISGRATAATLGIEYWW